MKKLSLKKRIPEILFFCLGLLTPGIALAQDVAATGSSAGDSVRIPHSIRPHMMHGDIRRTVNNPTQPHITLDEMRQKSDIESATVPQLSNPDFAFPQTVEKDAASIYRVALEESKPLTAIRAAMQLNIADNLITTDSVVPALQRYRYIADHFHAPYSSLAALLEARLLADIYSSDPYEFNSRTLPEDSAGENPLLWDGALFVKRIDALVEKVLRQRDVLSQTPVSVIAPLLSNAGEAEKAGMTAFDFATYRIVDLLNVIGNSEVSLSTDAIPFVSENGPAIPVVENPERRLTPLDVIDNLINYYVQDGDAGSEALLRARLAKAGILNYPRKAKYAGELLEIYGYSDKWRPLIVNQLINDVYADSGTPQQIEAKRIVLLETSIRDFPDSGYAPCLKSKLEIMTRPYLDIHIPLQVIPGKPAKASYESKNLEDFYVLLIPVAPPGVNGSYEQRQLKPKGEVKVISHITCDSLQFSGQSGDFEIPGLAAGYYAVVPSSTTGMTGLFPKFNRNTVPLLNVCGFDIFTSKGFDENNSQLLIYVSDAATGAPVKGAKYKCRSNSRQFDRTQVDLSGLTDENGAFSCPYESFDCRITYNGSRMDTRIWNYSESRWDMPQYSASIMPDLALYHPGDTINMVAVVSESNSNILSPAAAKDVTIELRDANYEPVTKVNLTTDKYGRATAQFTIPTDRITGTYSLLINSIDEKSGIDSRIGNCCIEVAEYKAPTFRVLLDAPVISDDTLEITGSVLTYSGMPIADVDVNIGIEFILPWWRRVDSANLPSNYNTVAVTGQSGRFSLKLGISPLLGTAYEAGMFRVSASATSDAGETETGNNQRFTLSPGFHIEMQDDTIEAEHEPISIPVKVTDVIGNPAVKELHYEVINEKQTVVTNGMCTSPVLKLPSSLMKSGRYRLRAILKDAVKEYVGPDKGKWKADTAECTIVVWRRKDKKPPYPTPLWIPQIRIYASPDSDVVDVKAGSGYQDSYLFYQVSDCDSIINEGWIKASDTNIRLHVNAPREGNRLKVSFRGIHDLQEASGSVIVLPAAENQDFRLTVETFRDKIDPAGHEQWRFLFSCDGMPVRNVPAMAVMSDAALNSIVPFRWSMGNNRLLRYNFAGRINSYIPGGYSGMGGYITTVKTNDDCNRFKYPVWNLWQNSLYGRYVAYKYMKSDNTARGVFPAAEPMTMATDNADKVYLTGSVAVRGNADGAAIEMDDMELSEEAVVSESTLEDIPLRDTRHPLAFFKPLLLTDDNGMVDVSFEVPDFNTTWAFQLLAYDEKMRNAYLSKEIVAAKPVMISTNMPRFLLTGDKATVAATMFNNSDIPLTINGRIEVMDPTTGKLIAFSDSGNVSVEPSANVTFNVEFGVPDDCNSLIIRSVARSLRGSDGEQEMIQVLPSSQPVLDATTFYLTPEERDLTMKLPRMETGDMVTLNYCANPAWYVLTSLSGFINPDSESTLTNLNALYANCVAGGLISRHPNLRKGLGIICDSERQDSSLTTSPLAQDTGLKLSILRNTPWVNNAESETMRMQSLNSLLDATTGKEKIKGILARLGKNQTGDGGFKWMPQMRESDLWITLNVLDCAARIKETGFSPSGSTFETMIVKALRYADTGIGRNYREVVHKNKSRYPLNSEISYLLTRSILTSTPPSGLIDEMRRDMLQRLPNEWKELSIADKALAARILKREGNVKLAREILESVKEFASYKADKGMWFDKLRDDIFSHSPKMVTATVIQALNEVLPEDEAIMRMCQYLVLSRQAEDWNLDMSPAAVTMTANAVLGADLGWTEPDAGTHPVITLNGRPLELTDSQALTGNIFMNLSPLEASGATLAITRTGSTPAWGGTLRQHLAPAKDVRQHSIPQLKVTKRLLKIDKTASGEKAMKPAGSFRKGDLIRVTLTLETDRDLDYVLINDRRGAFMQPAEQLTTYDVENGLWLLRETRNTDTNFYLTRLPKGVYLITYDVYADRDGEYSTGIATAQSQYYPLITAHSAGALVKVSSTE